MAKEKEQYTGQRGRKPLSATQKRDRSYPEKPENDSLKMASFLPMAPEEMIAEAKQEWQRVGEYLLLTDRVARLDAQALAFYANSYAIFAEGARQLLIGRSAMWGEVRGRPKPSKYVGLVVKHGAIVIRQARRFGMTARTRHLDHKAGVGRPASPSQIHALRGTIPTRPSRKRTPSDVQWDPASIARPTWFNRDAAAEWDRTVQQLEVVDLWTPLDVGPIAVSCGAYSLAAKCANDLADQQLVLPIQGAEGVVEHPLSEIYRELFILCETVWQDYGMTPHDRQQFHHIEGEQQGRPKLQVFPGEQA